MTTIVSIAPKFKHGEVIVEQQNFTLGKVTRMQLQNDHDIGVYMFSKFKQSLKREREKKMNSQMYYRVGLGKIK